MSWPEQMSFPPTASFENNVLKYTMSNASINSNNTGVMIGNGKVGAVTSFDKLGADSCMITCAYSMSPKEGNTIKTFNAFDLDFLQADTQLIEQSIDLESAIFNTKATVTPTNTAELLPPFNVSCSIYAPRNLPFCLVQTVKLDSGSNVGGSIPFYHRMSSPINICDPQYNNNVVYDDVGNNPIYILTAQGMLTGGRIIVSASAYIFECPYTNMGFNVMMDEPDKCFNYFHVDVSAAAATTPSKFHIITATLTSEDYDNPLEEAKRIILNIVNRGVANVRSEHVKQWMRIWDTSDVIVYPKPGIAASDDAAINMHRRIIKSSLYSIYSCVRTGINLEINPSIIGFMDISGRILYSGDLSLVPLLLLLKPDFARSLLDYRYKSLSVASKLAAGYGYKGAKYPYEDDRLGYKNALYWTTVSNMTIFNTAAVSINIWNYYRSVQDIEWLRSTGYPVLKANAEFFASVIELSCDDDGLCNTDNCHDIHIDHVVSITGIVSERDNTFTNNMVKLAFKYAIEASYEVAANVPEIWIDYYHNLPIPTNPPDLFKIDAATPTSPPPTPLRPIPEQLFLFMPSFVDQGNNHHQNVAYCGIDNQTKLYHNLAALKNDASTNPIAEWLVGTLNGLYAQSDPTYVDALEASLNKYIANHLEGSWGFFKDATISAMYVLMITQGLAQLNVKGGVAETKFYYAEMGVRTLTSANMPNAWRSIKIGTKLTQNVLYYVT